MPRAVRVLLVDDDDEFAADFATLSSSLFEVVRVAGYDAALRALEEQELHAIFLDIDLGEERSGIDLLRELRHREPDLPVIMISGDDRRETAVECLNLGAIEYVSKQPRLGELHAKIGRWWSDVRWRRHARGMQSADERIVGSSAAVRRLRETIAKVAPLDIRVLVQGETGTGKELVADTIHRESPRRDERLVKTSAANDPDELFEDRLFGHERGAFTGAARGRTGLLELASGGTLFLDEVGRLSLARQAKLLRAIEDRSFDPLGAERSVRSDFRLITASNEDLRARIAGGSFAEDFWFRIAEYVIHVPPLRQRREDIPALAEELVRRMASRGFADLSLAADACDPLLGHDWPGNVRELNNVLVKAAIETGAGEITADRTAQALAQWTDRTDGAGPMDLKSILESVERAHIVAALRRHARADDAAAALGIGRATLYRRIRELGIRRP